MAQKSSLNFQFLISLTKYILLFFEDSQKSISSRFDYLDGYRGFCALTVVIHHIVPFHSGKGDFRIFVMAGFFIGVFGFFVLSAFLLTYKMIKELEKCESWNQTVEAILKYFIRRFFRIYVPFMFFVTCVKLGPEYVKGNYKEYNTWLNLAMLEPALANHLWTIPIEIKFYFMIPILCVGFKLSNKYWMPVFLSSIGVMYWLYQTHLYYSASDAKLPTSNKLYVRFPIFYSGSLVAFFYYKYEICENKCKNLVKKRFSRFFIGICSFLMAIYGIMHFSPAYNPRINIYKDSLHPGIKFSFLLFFMLIGAPNDFTRLFSDNFFLKKLGKYSFGIYLWHPMCILVLKHHKFDRQLDAIAVVLAFTLFCATARLACGDGLLGGHLCFGMFGSLVVLKNGHLASVINYYKIKIWNTNDGSLKKTLTDPVRKKFIRSLAVLYNGNLVGGHTDGSIRIWNMSLIFGGTEDKTKTKSDTKDINEEKNKIKNKIKLYRKVIFISKTCKEYKDVFCGNRSFSNEEKYEKDFCSSRPNGSYPNFENGCGEYFKCENSKTVKKSQCPNGLKFNMISIRCDHESNILPPCGTKIVSKHSHKTEFNFIIVFSLITFIICLISSLIVLTFLIVLTCLNRI
ncbi:O-acetyltransferase oatA [Brachionus plicatilis]|uniref:O-acetyltransferase oatA n=1 Tax=Brachionus plicatilis TaxID=10195 RepID=A0A3M7R7V6_BRAPC|nr:O-acetyltransferase oatA [Brachionus plicatilis]